MGAVPDWYPVMTVAREFGVPPWDWAGIPGSRGCFVWTIWATQLRRAENQAQSGPTHVRL